MAGFIPLPNGCFGFYTIQPIPSRDYEVLVMLATLIGQLRACTNKSEPDRPINRPLEGRHITSRNSWLSNACQSTFVPRAVFHWDGWPVPIELPDPPLRNVAATTICYSQRDGLIKSATSGAYVSIKSLHRPRLGLPVYVYCVFSFSPPVSRGAPERWRGISNQRVALNGGRFHRLLM